ncbi:MAG: homocysteine S-methyltransferase family protein [Oscillospiraceae bacterium]
MNVRIPLPLLLDGATATNLIQAGMPSEQCPELWMLDNPDILIGLQESFINAGSDLLYTPTYTTNHEKLNEYDMDNELVRFNKELAQITKLVAGNKLVAGCLSSINYEAEPFGDIPFMDIISLYADQAFALKDGGVDLLVCDSLTSLAQCRGAIIGCRQTGLPVMVTISVDEDGQTSDGCTALSAMIVAQSLGVTAFGLSCCNTPLSLIKPISEMIPYAKIPLIARPNAGTHGNIISPEEMAKEMRPLLELGVQIIGACCNSTAAHIAKLRELIDTFNFASVKLEKVPDDIIIMCSDTEAYFLDEMFELSDEITCRLDMSDLFLELEQSCFHVACIVIDSIEDAYTFCMNSHMLRMPVAFLSDNEEALEMALLMYNGRAFIDARSSIDEDILNNLAAHYGAVIR